MKVIRRATSNRLRLLVSSLAFLLIALPAGTTDWQPLGPYGGTILDINRHPTDPDLVYAVSGLFEAGVFLTDDGGATWRAVNDGIDFATYLAASRLAQDPARPDRLFLGVGVSTTGRLYRSLDGGASWTPTGPEAGEPRGVAIDPTDPDRVFFCTLPGRVFRSADGGGGWSEVTPVGVTACWSMLVDPDDGSVVYLGTSQGLWRSDDGGVTFADLGSTTRTVAGIVADPIVSGRIYLNALPWGLWRSDDRGETLVDILGDLPSTRTYSRVAPDPVNPARLRTGSGDGVWLSEDGGIHWVQQNAGLDSDIRSGPDYINDVVPDPDDPLRVFAGGDSGLWETRDDGSSWVRIGAPAHDVAALAPDPADPARVMAGTVYGIYHPASTDGYAPGRQCVSDVGFSTRALETDDGWVFLGYATAFLDAALLRTGDGCAEPGGTENVLLVPGADSVSAVSPEPGGDVVLAAVSYPSAGNAAIYRSTNGGEAGSFVPVPGTATYSWITDFVWEPVAGGQVLAVSNSGFVYASINHGSQWVKIREGTGDAHYAVARQPDVPGVVYVARNGGIDRSVDAGQNFLPFALAGEDVTALEIPENDPDVMFAASRGVGVRRSVDRGATWETLGTGLAHLNVRDVRFRAETDLLFAATRGGGVYRLVGAGRIGPDLDLDGIGDGLDNCVSVPNPDQTDGDLDTVGDPCDCAPADGGAHHAPSEVTGLVLDRAPSGDAVLTWLDPRQAAGSATAEDVVSGDLDALHASGGYGEAGCLASGLGEPTYTDGRPHPAPGTGWYYVVRAVNACGPGTHGDAGGIAPDPRDDLDGGGPCL